MSMSLDYITLSVLTFSYLLGSLNSAIVMCYLFRLESPRNVGSGNPGTTNVLRIGGKFPAALTLILDILKGVIPVIIAKMVSVNSETLLYLSLMYAVIGHIFPVFFDFKGGKGVATFIGGVFAINWIVGFVFLAVWLLVAFVSKISSLSALVAIITCSIILIVINPIIYNAIPLLLTCALVIFKHKDNIKRIINKQESKIGDKVKTAQ